MHIHGKNLPFDVGLQDVYMSNIGKSPPQNQDLTTEGENSTNKNDDLSTNSDGFKFWLRK